LGRRSARLEDGAFVVEGPVLTRELLASDLEVEALYLGPGAPLDLRAAGVPLVDLAEGVAERVSTTVTGQPVLAVARRPEAGLERIAAATFVVAGARLADPGNLGTILRTAEAAGAGGVALTAGSVDPWNPKVVRASAGAVFHVPVVEVDGLADLRPLDLELVATVVRGGEPYDARRWTDPVAVVLGNEAAGLTDEELAACDSRVSVPHAGRSESLNVAMAAAVVCFEVARARRDRA
jgi:RNA methyltransferase, TrmH family